jgi:ElaB/YqjD/DUF883 family membrane-anchored ribosome-binding protein
MNSPLPAAIAANTARRPKEVLVSQFDELFDGVDDLIKRVADVENPEIRRIRARVHAAMVVAKSACKDGATEGRGPSSRVASPSSQDRSPPSRVAPDVYLDEYPSEALGVGLLVGLGLGLIVSMRQ